MISYEQIIKFWFDDIKPEQRWKKDDVFDNMISDRFKDIHSKASKGELKLWRKDPSGSLAEIIILDQFSRNIFRDKPESFASDKLAIEAAKEAIGKGFDNDLNIDQLGFLYMPFMHSESLSDHEQAMKLFKKKGLESMYEYECKHKKIIDRFGRYPHRNQILGRESTSEEIEFLKTPGSSF